MTGGVVVVFDLNKTLLDCDGDNWVADELGVDAVFTQLLPALPWNSLMMELYSKGKTIEDIAKCLKEAPLIHPRIVSTDGDLRILSDTNVFFIETILNHHDLLDCFSQINTNPSFVEMFKGTVMQRIFKPCEGKKRFIYVDNGNADFCAGLKLVEGDILTPRNNFPVWVLISSNPLSIKADIHPWSDGKELGNSLLNLINTNLIEESCSTSEGPHLLPPAAADCKFQTSALLAHDSFSNDLPIPH